MKHKFYIILIIISLLIAGLGLILNMLNPNDQIGELTLNLAYGSAYLLGLILLVLKGTTIKTSYRLVLILFSYIWILGLSFKILHFPGANLMNILSTLGIILTYTIRFIFKTGKIFLDIIKVLWVMTFFIGTASIILHLNFNWIIYLAYGIFWIMLILFLIRKQEH